MLAHKFELPIVRTILCISFVLVNRYHSTFPPFVWHFLSSKHFVKLLARSIPTALSAGAALAVTSAIVDIGGQTTRIDNGKEYYPYTTEKGPSVS
ncbi:hypothetical protein AMTRI_Chr03g44690 [Amborella trichopoda]